MPDKDVMTAASKLEEVALVRRYRLRDSGPKVAIWRREGEGVEYVVKVWGSGRLIWSGDGFRDACRAAEAEVRRMARTSPHWHFSMSFGVGDLEIIVEEVA